MEFIKLHNGVSRKEINEYIYPFLESKNEKELNNKTRYIITYLRESNLIENIGTKNKPKWIKK